jgi:hypothetical protein
MHACTIAFASFFLFWFRIVIALPHGNATFVMGLAVSLVRFLCWLLLLCDMLFVVFGEKKRVAQCLVWLNEICSKIDCICEICFCERSGNDRTDQQLCEQIFSFSGTKLRCIFLGYFFLMNHVLSCTLNLMYHCAKYVVCTSSSIRVLFCQIIPRCFSQDRSVSSCCCPYEVSKFAMCFFRLTPLYNWFTERAGKRGMVF